MSGGLVDHESNGLTGARTSAPEDFKPGCLPIGGALLTFAITAAAFNHSSAFDDPTFYGPSELVDQAVGARGMAGVALVVALAIGVIARKRKSRTKWIMLALTLLLACGWVTQTATDPDLAVLNEAQLRDAGGGYLAIWLGVWILLSLHWVGWYRLRRTERLEEQAQWLASEEERREALARAAAARNIIEVRERRSFIGEYSAPGPEPEARLIRHPADAEEVAAEWMRYWGFSDATRTPPGPDGGVDVNSSRAVAQVKMQGVATSRPALQQIVGAAAPDRKRVLFFSLGGYTREALDWAMGAGVALFTFDLQGTPEPVNQIAAIIARRG